MIYDNKKFINVCWVCSVLAILLLPSIPANAATDNGCSNDENDRINPELALCTTHTYNIGLATNPETDADKQLMRDVVALKATVITQQMYKQYEYLDATIRRLKTQLEKAVLTTKLQAAGAESESSSSSGGTGFKDRNIYMAGVSNCNNKLTNLQVFECLNENLNSIYNASNNGANITIELRKQLANDCAVAKNALGGTNTIDVVVNDKTIDCTQYQNLAQRSAFQGCLDNLRAKIRTGYENAQAASQKNNSKAP